MSTSPLRVLIVEDSEDDALLLVRLIRNSGHDVTFERVADAKAMAAALKNQSWDLVISDYVLPGFSALAALKQVKAKGDDIPFIMVSGTIGEEAAVEAMTAGAHDYVMKTNLPRLMPAITRELREAEERRQRKRAEEALRRSEERFSKAFHASPTAMAMQRVHDGVFVDVNNAFLELVGYTRDELIGRTSLERGICEKADRDATREILLADGIVRNREIKLRAKSQQVLTVLVSMEAIDIAGEKCALASVIDITERKRLEEQFRQAQKMEAFGQLAAGIAHDFNNIMTVVQGNLALMKMGLAQKDQAAATDQIVRAAERATNLTRQLLMFSRRSPIQPKDLDLNDVVNNMTKMLKTLIGEHIALAALYSTNTAMVHADPGMMEQVLLNLAVNSRDAMAKGGRISIETSCVSITDQQAQGKPKARPGRFVCLSVRDTGCGIAPEHIPHIFEPFFTTKEVGKGTGLGLATVFGIVEQHHGWIEVESQLNCGTTFRVFLPALASNAERTATRSAGPDVKGGTETILLVEDEPAVRKMMAELLQHHGYQVHTATSGVDALQVWKNHGSEIRLLVTDMVMPEGINGRELADQMQSQKPDLKIIYISGYTDDMLGANSPLRNNANFIEKPFESHRFLRRIRACLDDARPNADPAHHGNSHPKQ